MVTLQELLETEAKVKKERMMWATALAASLGVQVAIGGSVTVEIEGPSMSLTVPQEIQIQQWAANLWTDVDRITYLLCQKQSAGETLTCKMYGEKNVDEGKVPAGSSIVK